MARCSNCFSKTTDVICPVCGFNNQQYAQPSYALPPLTLLHDRYYIGRVIGKGGYGLVYAGWDIQQQQHVAVKEFLPLVIADRLSQQLQLTPHNNKKQAYRKLLHHFMHEAEVLTKLQSIPGIVMTVDLFQQHQTAYLCMERLQGLSLKERLGGIQNGKSKHKLSIQDAQTLWYGTLPILEKLHSQHPPVFHRDLTPGNLFLRDNKIDQLVLLDFGLARLGERIEEHHSVLAGAGTPGFAAPELLSGIGKCGPATDFYTLAATVYTTLSGQVPPTIAQRLDGVNLPPLSTSIDSTLTHALERCLTLKYEQRPQTVHEIQQLTQPNDETVLPDIIIKPLNHPPPPKIRKQPKNKAAPRKHRRYLWVLLLSLFVIIIAHYASYWQQFMPSPIPPSPPDTWYQKYGGLQWDHVNALQITPHHQLLAAGLTQITPDHPGHRWLFQTSSNGQLNWQKTFPSPEKSAIRALHLTQKQLLVAGYQTRQQQQDLWLAKLTPSGTIRWQHTLDNNPKNNDGAYAILGLKNNDIAVAGYQQQGSRNIWLGIFTPNGKQKWSKTIPSPQNDAAYTLAQNPDQTLLVAGKKYHNNTAQAWLAKFSPNGRQIWQKHLKPHTVIRDIALLENGNIVVVGVKNQDKKQSSWVAMLSPQAKILWEYQPTFQHNHGAYAVETTADQIIIGGEYKQASNNWNVWLRSLNQQRQVLWQKNLASQTSNKLTDLQLSSKHILLAGYQTSTQGTDAWLQQLLLPKNISPTRSTPPPISHQQRQYEAAQQLNIPVNFQDYLQDNSSAPPMIIMPPGRFLMGSPPTELGRDNDEQQHWVTIKKPYAISQYEITFNDYDKFCLDSHHPIADDSGWGRDIQPVINISWQDAIAYTQWLSQQTGHTYRLPTEAEWEYAAHAQQKNTTAACIGCTQQRLKSPQLTGQYSANLWQLYDIIGNVWEWTCSSYTPHYLGEEQRCAQPKLGTQRMVIRGGAWNNLARDARSANRYYSAANIPSNNTGMRIVMELKTFQE